MDITLIQRYGSCISIRIETNTVCLQINTSYIFDPFEELYIWLGRIRDRVLPTKMAINEEAVTLYYQY